MTYYVQKFMYDGPGESICYGAEDAHDHGRANQFTTDVKTYLVAQGCTNIQSGPFRSGQPAPNPGKLFTWNGHNWVH